MTKILIKIEKSLIIILLVITISSCSNNEKNNENYFCYRENGNTIMMLNSYDRAQNMSFIIHTNDDYIFVIDGGFSGDAPQLLKEIKKYGNVVNGWFITHYHSDHSHALANILQTQNNDIKIENIFCNFPNITDVALYEPNGIYEYEYSSNILNSAQCIKVNNDECYIFGEHKIKILRTYNQNIHNEFGNNSSTVYLFDIDNCKICFLGDLGFEGGQELLDLYSNEDIMCDMVQVAHHGQYNVPDDVYNLLKPKIALWPTPTWLWNNDGGNGINSGDYTTYHTRELMEKLNTHNIVLHYTTKIVDF